MQIQREQWIDIAKFFGIFFVVFGHIYDLAPVFSITYVYSFHIIIFWFLSGYCYKKSEKLQSILHRARRLLVPYYFFSFLLLIFFFIFVSRSLFVPNWKEIIFRLILGVPNWLATPLWFLYALFIVSALFQIVITFCDNKKIAIAILMIIGFFLGLIGKLQTGNGVIVDFFHLTVGGAGVGLFWFSFAYFLKNNNFNIKRPSFWITVFYLGLSLILTWLSYMYLTSQIILYFFSYILAAIGLLAWLSISGFINSRLLSFVGRNTIVILALHEVIIKIIQKTNESLLPLVPGILVFRSNNLFLQIIIPIILTFIAIIISLLVGYIWRQLIIKLKQLKQLKQNQLINE